MLVGVERQCLDLPQEVNVNHVEVLMKADQVTDNKSDQGLKLTSNVSCGTKQEENVQEEEKMVHVGNKESAMNQESTLLSCRKERNKIGERASEKNKSKLSFKSLPCTINKK